MNSEQPINSGWGEKALSAYHHVRPPPPHTNHSLPFYCILFNLLLQTQQKEIMEMLKRSAGMFGGCSDISDVSVTLWQWHAKQGSGQKIKISLPKAEGIQCVLALLENTDG